MCTEDEEEMGPLSGGLGGAMMFQKDEGWPSGPPMSDDEAKAFVGVAAAAGKSAREWLERFIAENWPEGGHELEDGHVH